MSFSTIGVVGAGVMGADLAFDLACHGYGVILKDIDESVINSAKKKMLQNLRLMKMVKSDYPTLSKDDLLKAVTFTVDYDAFASADMVIENVTEDFGIKEKVYNELRQVCGAATVYGVNTSCISITKIGALMPDPALVIGMHFMNPVPMKEMVEVIRGHFTSDETINRIEALLSSMSKTGVVVNDYPGFVTNRVLMLTINEAIWTVQDGVAKPKDVDKIFRLGFAHKMGPLATGDLIGLDTILKSLLVLYESYNDPKYRPCPLLVKMVDAGLLGKKSGKGFFNYDS